MKSYIIYYSCLTIRFKTKRPLDDLDTMTEIINMTEDMVKIYPVDGGVYLTSMFLEGAKQDVLNSDAPGFLTEMVNKGLGPKMSVMLVFVIELKNKSNQKKFTLNCFLFIFISLITFRLLSSKN